MSAMGSENDADRLQLGDYDDAGRIGWLDDVPDIEQADSGDPVERSDQLGIVRLGLG
jgi:hypothetical protein